MSAATLTEPVATPIRKRVAVKPVSLPRVVSSEWIKLRTLRSTYWTYGVAFAVWIGFTAMAAWAYTTIPADDRGAAIFEAEAASLATQGIQMVQLVVVVIGVLFISGEYSTGQIRSTFAAVPRRLDALWAKTLVLSVVTFGLSLVTAFTAFFVQMPFMTQMGYSTSLGDPHQIRILVGSALYLTIAALLALGLGTIIRNSAGGIAAAIGILFVLPMVAAFLPSSWSENISPWLPTNAGSQIIMLPNAEATLGNWQGLGVFFLYAAATIIVGAVLMKKRDA